MDLDRLRRRPFLGGVTAAVASLAGCGEDRPETVSDSEPPTDATASPTDTDTATASATETEPPAELPEHDHSSAENGGDSLSPESVEATTVSGESVTAGDITARRGADGALIARPGELRSVLDDAESGAVVRLLPRQYRPGEPVTVPADVTLDFNEGYIEVDSDHDVLVVDNGSRLVSPRVIVPPDLPYSSTVLHYDTRSTTGSRAGGSYDPHFDQHVDVDDLRIEASRYPDADQSDSVGVHLDARGGYIMYNRIDGRIGGLGTQILGTTSGNTVVENEGNTLTGYINGNRLRVDLRGAQDTHVRHAAVAGGSAMRSLIQGEIQPTTNVTDWGLVNETRKKSLFFRGVFWDAGSMNEAVTRGTNITMDIEGNREIDPEDFQTGETRETTLFTARDSVYGWYVQNGDGNSVAMRPNDTEGTLYTDREATLDMFPTGGVSPPAQDLAAIPEGDREHGALYRHDGTGEITTREGAARTPGYYVWDRGDGAFLALVGLSG